MTWRKLTIAQAERIAGRRLDRRRKYWLDPNATERIEKVCIDLHFSATCYNCDGSGCRECGGYGKRRRHFPCPVLTHMAVEERKRKAKPNAS